MMRIEKPFVSKNILFALFLAVFLVVALPVKQAKAYCTCCSCYCIYTCCNMGSTNQFITDAFNDYRSDFIMDSFYKNQFEKQGLKPMSDNLRNAVARMGLMIGAFLDGYTENAALAKVQKLNADTMKDYHVSDQICRVGTLSRSLAATETKMEVQQTIMSARGLARNSGRKFSSGVSGRGRDNYERMYSFVKYYCDNMDNNKGLSAVCQPLGNVKETRDVEYNRDIDFTKAFEEKETLNIDFTDNTLTRDENTIMNLSNFLYGHTQESSRMSSRAIYELSGSIELYAQNRSFMARRAVAQNSFSKIMAMKSGGSGAAQSYITNFMGQLGMGAADVNKYYGGDYFGTKKAPYDNTTSASYFAQMGVLSKKLYQDPKFYVNLMDTKANVKRISASMEAIDLAQTRDIFESTSRSEMLMAVLLDLEARKQIDENSGSFTDPSQ
ncbi:MAG: hypothetical protein RBR86_06650 [Pseudobdellovibrionaceae bacterium]|jgi:hypothetical protein|nr:hypothetical protein [Pseudobdellovibrionaceae bacterium]